MKVVERFIGKDVYIIKKIVNESAKKYDNFKHFAIKYSNTNSISSMLYLYFDESHTLKSNKKICVEHLKDIYYKDAGEVIKNASIDFDGYVSSDIVINNDRLVDIFLTYEIEEFNGDLNLKYIKKISGGGCLGDTYQRQENFEFYNYLGEDFYSEYREKYNVGWNLMFKYAREHIMILKNYYMGNEESLFKLSIDKDNENKIKISKFVNEDDKFYGSPVVEIDYKEIKVDNMMEFVVDLIKSIEDELRIKISKPTFKYIEEKLISNIKVRKDKICEK